MRPRSARENPPGVVQFVATAVRSTVRHRRLTQWVARCRDIFDLTKQTNSRVFFWGGGSCRGFRNDNVTGAREESAGNGGLATLGVKKRFEPARRQTVEDKSAYPLSGTTVRWYTIESALNTGLRTVDRPVLNTLHTGKNPGLFTGTPVPVTVVIACVTPDLRPTQRAGDDQNKNIWDVHTHQTPTNTCVQRSHGHYHSRQQHESSRVF